MTRAAFLAAVLCLVAGAAAAASTAGRPPPVATLVAQSDQDRAQRALEEGKVRPLPDILSAVHRDYAGRQVEVRLTQRGGRWVYHLKWLTPQNNVLAIAVDGASARILDVRGRGADAARRH